jgi:hypothetical protein
MLRHAAIAAFWGLAAALTFVPQASTQTTADCPSQGEVDAAPTRVRSGDAEALAAFLAAPSCHHWVTFYFAGEKLFEAGRHEEGLRWFYVGQIRGRTIAQLDRGGGTSPTVQALQHLIGQPLNEYAGRDQQGMVAVIDWAVAWDGENPLTIGSVRGLGNSFDWSGTAPLPFRTIQVTSDQFETAYQAQRAGIAGLRAAIVGVAPEQWRRMRRENGLED